MAETQDSANANSTWSQKQVYVTSVICLIIGLAFGYLLRGSATAPAPATAATPPVVAQAPVPAPSQMPSLDDMKRMADKQSEPLVAQLKKDPKNPDLLIKIGRSYKNAHQFAEAAKYFAQALSLNPKDVALRDEVGAAQYYSGDTDAAMITFEEGLKYAPNDPSTLYDLGLLRLQKKGDARGAIELWQRLIDTHPELTAEKRSRVEKLIADAKSGPSPASR